MCGNYVSLPSALSGVKPAKYVDTDIQFSCSSRIKRQNHKYHYSEHLFDCQEKSKLSVFGDIFDVDEMYYIVFISQYIHLRLLKNL